MSEAKRARVRLGPLERAVLSHLWSEPAAHDVVTVHDAIGAARGVTRNTIHSTLERLVRKRLVARRRRGRAYEYAAVVERADWLAEAIEAVVGDLAKGDREAVLAGFVAFAERTSASTLDALETMVRARREARDREGQR